MDCFELTAFHQKFFLTYCEGNGETTALFKISRNIKLNARMHKEEGLRKQVHILFRAFLKKNPIFEVGKVHFLPKVIFSGKLKFTRVKS